MQEFYLTVEQFGDSIFERYIDSNGHEQVREVTYAPCMFMHSNEPTEYKDIYGKYCVKKMDGRQVEFTEEDETRRDSITWLLEDWGLIEIAQGQRSFMKELTNNFRVISFKQKHEWTLKSKYTIGN